MAVILEERAPRGSSYIIQVGFNEKVGDTLIPFTPNSGVQWWLRDEGGEIVNGRDGVDIASDEVIYIPLSGDDLELVGSDYSETRTVEVLGTYNSIIGQNMIVRLKIQFQIDD